MPKRNADTRRHRSAGVIILLALMLICAPVFAQDGEISEWLTFEQNDNVSIYVYDTLTGETRVLAKGFGSQWSPDGDRLMYVAPHDDKISVTILNIENDSEFLLLDVKNNLMPLQGLPRWLSNEKIILSLRGVDGLTCRWYIVDANGENLRLPAGQDDEICDAGKTYRSYNDHYLMLRDINADNGFYVINADSEEFTRYSGMSGATWSPVANQLTFTSSSNGNWEIYIMEFETGDIRQLTDQPEFFNVSPTWSSDGQEIAFVAYTYAKPTANSVQIDIIHTDGTNMRRFKVGVGLYCDVGFCISWTDDSQIIYETLFGSHFTKHALDIASLQMVEPQNPYFWDVLSSCERYIAFLGDDSHLYVRDVNGSNVRQVARSGVNLATIHWRPQPECMEKN